MSVCSIRFAPVLPLAATSRATSYRTTPLSRPGHPPATSARPTLQPTLGATTGAALRKPRSVHVRAQAPHARPADGFSHRLFVQTHGYHEKISKHEAMQALGDTHVISGKVYWRMLVDKLAFHTALEALLHKHRDEALLAPFRAPVLARSERLRHDLRMLEGKAHIRMPKPAPASDAARDYIESMALAARRDPRSLAAHAWLHYLGDMHGGQLMRQRLAGKHGDDTVSAFAFSEPVETLRKVYGQALDVPLADYEQKLLTEQAIGVYEHSLRMHDAWLNP